MTNEGDISIIGRVLVSLEAGTLREAVKLREASPPSVQLS